MEWLTTATTTVTSLMDSTVTLITGNTILSLIFATGTIIPLGMSLFRRLKRTAR